MEKAEQVALVTGAGRGIGRAIAVEQAKEGRDVVIADLDEDEMAETEEQIKDVGEQTLTLHTDLRDPDSVQKTIDVAEDEFGSIDILVNNSGISGPTADCEEVSIESWDEILAVNLRGAYLMSKLVIPSMKRQEFGRIINIASVTGKRPVPERTPYAASKMGLIGFTRSLAAEVGEYNINLNAICPGSVGGPENRTRIRLHAESKGVSSEEVKQREIENSARKELVDRRSIAHAVAFLSSEEATQITGQDLNISAGKVMF